MSVLRLRPISHASVVLRGFAGPPGKLLLGGLCASLLMVLTPCAQATLTVVPDAKKAAPVPPPPVPAPDPAPSARPPSSSGAPGPGKGQASPAPSPAAKPAGASSPSASRRDEPAVREVPAGKSPRTVDPARAACSDELVALSLGTLGQDDIERLRSKGCLPSGSEKK